MQDIEGEDEQIGEEVSPNLISDRLSLGAPHNKTSPSPRHEEETQAMTREMALLVLDAEGAKDTKEVLFTSNIKCAYSDTTQSYHKRLIARLSTLRLDGGVLGSMMQRPILTMTYIWWHNIIYIYTGKKIEL
jgi:hypothetical protein